jgi:membrane protease YdiL (CAAX protease family)
MLSRTARGSRVDLDRLSPRTRGIAGLVLSVPLVVGTWFVLISWGPFGSLGFLAFIGLGDLATVALVLLLLLGIRGRTGWRSTLSTWFGPRGLRSLAFGLGLTLPLLLTMLFVRRPRALTLPSPDTLEFAALSVLAAPLMEEVFFRGFLFSVLIREVRLNAWLGLALTSLLFGAVHPLPGELFTLDGGANAMFHAGAGAFLCWAYWRRTEDLWFPLGFHAGLNLWGYFFVPLGPRESLSLALAQQYGVILTMTLAYVVLRVLEGRKARAGPGEATST